MFKVRQLLTKFFPISLEFEESRRTSLNIHKQNVKFEPGTPKIIPPEHGSNRERMRAVSLILRVFFLSNTLIFIYCQIVEMRLYPITRGPLMTLGSTLLDPLKYSGFSSFC